jgi:hypothetical protein
VLRLAGKSEPVLLGRLGPWVATTRAQAHEVLSNTECYDFPGDVSRERLDRSRGATAATRSPHPINPPVAPDRVAEGRAAFEREWGALLAETSAARFDAMQILRTPVAVSTTTAVLPQATQAQCREIGERVLGWIDALGPVIASRFGASRWSPRRRRERLARESLESALRPLCDDPPVVATLLAAGIQVPIAAGAWLLVELASNPGVQEAVRRDESLVAGVVWETLRLCPPTWITARVTTGEALLAGQRIEDGMMVMVSPLLLGRSPHLVPGPESGAASLEDFAPSRWGGSVRPGAWLPFGAGPHACPGRNLGLAQLTALASWARGWDLRKVRPVAVNQSRGIFPDPAALSITPLLSDQTGASR